MNHEKMLAKVLAVKENNVAGEAVLNTAGKDKIIQNTLKICLELYEKTKIDYFGYCTKFINNNRNLTNKILRTDWKKSEKKVILSALKEFELKNLNKSKVITDENLYTHMLNVMSTIYKKALREINFQAEYL